MMTLLANLGEENTRRACEEFVRLAIDNHQDQVVTLRSKACVGIAYA